MKTLLESVSPAKEREYEAKCKKFSEDLAHYGSVNIVCFPSYEATLATSIVIYVLEENNIPFTLTVTPIYTYEEYVNSAVNIIIGCPVVETDLKKVLYIIASNLTNVPPKPGLTVFTGITDHDSLPSIAMKVLSELWIIEDSMLTIPSLLFIERIEEDVAGFDAEILAEAERRGVLEGKTSLKFFFSESLPAYVSLSKTVRPYIPGITGNEKRAIEFLEDLGIHNYSDTLIQLSERDLSDIAKTIYLILKDKSLRRRGVNEIIGKVYRHKESVLEYSGAREKGLLYLSIFGRFGPHGLAYSFLSKYYIGKVLDLTAKVDKILSDIVEKILESEMSEKEGVLVVEVEDESIIPILHITLRELGLLKNGIIVAYSSAQGIIVPYFCILEALDVEKYTKCVLKAEKFWREWYLVFNNVKELKKVLYQ